MVGGVSVTARHIEYMALDEVPRAERNPRQHDVDQIRLSLATFGCTVAGILDERTGRLVAGHGRLAALEAMRADGDPPPKGVEADKDGRWRVPIVRGWASQDDEEAEAYLLADNRITERGGWDDPLLAQILDGLASHSIDLLVAAGYDADDLDDVVAAAGEVPVLPPAPTSATYAETPEEAAERRERIASYQQRSAGGALTEMILVFTVEEHSEAVELIRTIRERDGDLPLAQVVLAALRTHAGAVTAAADGDGAGAE